MTSSSPPEQVGAGSTAASLIAEFIASKDIKPKTRYAYGVDLGIFEAWLSEQNLTLPDITAGVLRRYRLYVEKRTQANATRNWLILTARQFLLWCEKGQILARDTAVALTSFELRRTALRPTLTVEQLGEMWASCQDDRSRVVIGLLGFNALKLDELLTAEFSDCEVSGDLTVLRVRRREGRHGLATTVLGPPVAAALAREHKRLGAGPIARGRSGQPANRHNVAKVVRTAARRCGIVTFEVRPSTLSDSLPRIAVERGFTFESVVRAVSDTSGRLSQLTTRSAPSSPVRAQDSASLRLTRLATLNPLSSQFLLEEALSILRSSDLPDGLAVALSGAILERHLRALLSIDKPVKPPPTLTSLGSKLRALGLLTEQDVQQIAYFAGLRDRAAHGWYETFSKTDAQRVVHEVKAFVERLPAVCDSP